MVQLTSLVNRFAVFLVFLEYVLFGTLGFTVFFKNKLPSKKRGRNL